MLYSSLNEKPISMNYQLRFHYQRVVKLTILKALQCFKTMPDQIATWHDCNEAN